MKYLEENSNTNIYTLAIYIGMLQVATVSLRFVGYFYQHFIAKYFISNPLYATYGSKT